MADEALIEMIDGLVRGGHTPDDAARRLGRMVDREEVAKALEEFRRRTGRIRTLRDPRSLVGEAPESWYTGPQETDLFWPSLRSILEADPGWSSEDVESLNDASNRIVSLLHPPGAGRIDTRGLALGHVQAGKTTNYTAVISKAADAGYKLFIVLSGVTNSLRRQTQRRLEEQLVTPNDAHWGALTSVDADFRYFGNPNFFLTDKSEQKVLCVVKKNGSRLRALLRWLGDTRGEILRQCPVLLIDDEADQASVNASRYADDGERTRINQLVVNILATLPKVAYVGYTATPFANLFIDPIPEDLYPRHFIVDLPKPPGHFGTETIFGREPLFPEEEGEELDGYDMVRIVDDDEVEDLQPPSAGDRFDFYPSMTGSLRDALHYFWMATAARFVRAGSSSHSTMLIHTTVFTSVHENFLGPIETERDRLAAALEGWDRRAIDALRQQWETEQARVPSVELGEAPVSFEELLPKLGEVTRDTDVLADNYRARVRLDYSEGERTVIVVGGNTLSRGLTLEGLVVSFFLRTATAYDTLLQMGRWFGYRPGYADLPRLWMTSELNDYFRDLATVEREMRIDIERYEVEGITPLDFAVRIRTHPALNITSALKMQHARPAEVSYSGRRIQTILFKHRDRGWLDSNLTAARELLSSLLADGKVAEPIEDGSKWLLRDVDVAHVTAFLENYSFHERSFDLNSDLIRRYIGAQNDRDSLRRWNVAIVGRGQGSKLGSCDLGIQDPVPLLNRSRMKRSDDSYADIKALMSPVDRGIDLGRDSKELQDMDDAEIQELRPEGIGLLLLYPISRESRPMRQPRPGATTRRAPLEAVEDVLGVGLVFPEAVDETPQTYMSADLSRYANDEPEFDPEEEDEPESEEFARAR